MQRVTKDRSSPFSDFRGDYDELAAVMEASWAKSAAPPFLYTPEFLADCFRYPGSTFSLAPSIYRDSKLAAFVAGFPRRISVQGTERKVLIVAFLTAASAYNSMGYGILVWSELMRRAAALGFDGVVNYCVQGEAMSAMIEGSARRLGLPVLRVSSFSYLSRVLWPRGSARPEAVKVEPALLVAAVGRLSEHTSLSRLWTADEAVWQLGRAGGVSVVSGAASEPGILTGYVLPIADPKRTRCLIVEDVLWGSVTRDEREELTRDLVAEGVAAGARVAIVPSLEYADLQPFVATGFRPSRKRIDAYLTLWNGSMPDSPASSYYLDVF